jgi:hypothetical protein
MRMLGLNVRDLMDSKLSYPREGKEIPASYCHYSSQAEKQNSRTADIM